MDMSRIEREKRVVGMMVRLYCRKQEGNDCLCEECRALLEYAHARLEHCRLENVKLRVNIVKYIAINPVCGRKCGR